jgi:hypothetical protein
MFTFFWTTPPLVKFYLLAPIPAQQMMDSFLAFMWWC